MNLVEKVEGIILKPSKTWPEIKEKSRTISALYLLCSDSCYHPCSPFIDWGWIDRTFCVRNVCTVGNRKSLWLCRSVIERKGDGSIYKNRIVPTTQISPTPQGQQIDLLNWNAGIKFSLIKNRPTFSYPPRNSTLPLGWIWVNYVNLS